MQLVLIGIQGSGKGTQARILQKEKGFKIFETGQALRNITKTETELGKKVKKIIEQGKQVSPDIIEDILKNFIKTSKTENIIFDGLVRNEGNKKTADKFLDKNYKVLYFELPEDIAMERLLGRMYNPTTGETFPSGTKIDPNTGEKLIKRSDDEENSIKQRIKEFYEKTLPLIDIYEKEGRLIKINANQDLELVTKEILEKIKK